MEVCLAVLYRKDKRYSGNRRPVAIPYRQDFRRYVRFNRTEISDEVLVILMGGSHIVTTLDEVSKMEWTL